MKKLKYFLLILPFLFISNVKAGTYNMNYEYYQQYYDNSGSSVTAVSTNWNESLQSYVSADITTVANSYGAGLSISSPIPLLANHTYSMSIYFDGLSNISLSSKNNIAIGTSLSNASSNYVNANYLTTMNYSSVSNNTILKFAFTTSSNGTFIFIPWTTTSTLSQSYVLTQLSIDDLGSGGISQADINNSLNNQTNIIQNSINDVKDSINDNIKDTFESCKPSKNLANINEFEVSGGDGLSFGREIINLKGNTTYTLSFDKTRLSGLTIGNNALFGWSNIRFYNGSNLISTINNPSPNPFFPSGSVRFTYTFTTPSNCNRIIVYFDNNNGDTNFNTLVSKIQLELGSSATSYENYGEICQNKIDETNDKLDNIDDTLKDDNIDNSKTTIEDKSADASNSPISSLLTLPLKLLNNIHTGLSGTCSSLNLGSLLGTDLVLPCINLEQRLGSYLWGLIDYAFCIFLIYNVGMLAVKIWTDVIMMRDFFSELYKPQGEKGGKDK